MGFYYVVYFASYSGGHTSRSGFVAKADDIDNLDAAADTVDRFRDLALSYAKQRLPTTISILNENQLLVESISKL